MPSEERHVVQSCRRLNPEVETYRTEYNLFWSPQRRSHKGINFMPWLLTHQSFKALSSFPTPAALWLLRYETDCCWVFLCSDVTFQGCSQIFKWFFVKSNIMCFIRVEALVEMFSLAFVKGKVIVESNWFLSANLLKDLLRTHSLTWCSWWKSICSVFFFNQTAAGRLYSPAVEPSYSGPCANNACLSLFQSGCFLLLLCNSCLRAFP